MKMLLLDQVETNDLMISDHPSDTKCETESWQFQPLQFAICSSVPLHSLLSDFLIHFFTTNTTSSTEDQHIIQPTLCMFAQTLCQKIWRKASR